MKLGLQIPDFTWPAGPAGLAADLVGPPELVTTLDVLSGGRAWLGIGAAWNDKESKALSLFFPPTAERFERLEETLQICLQMWSDDESAYDGRHYRLGRTRNSPPSLSRPHPPIMIGGSGEKKTLRLVAKCPDGGQAQEVVDTLGGMAEAGIQTVVGAVVGVSETTPLEIIGAEVIPAVAGL